MRRALRWLCGLAALAAFVDACSTDCNDLMSEASDLKDELGACAPGDTCIAVTVSDDCLGGALACGFAVPSSKAQDAQSRAQAIADESLDCNPCAQAECASHGAPSCDAATGRCVFGPP